MPERSSLVPIRVDAWSSDKQTRIVDTLLLDAHLWPLPLVYDSPSLFSASIERNCQYLTDQILNDAEVMGMGRTVRHFTNRVELWSHGLHREIADQIRAQLWSIATRTPGGRKRKRKADTKSTIQETVNVEQASTKADASSQSQRPSEHAASVDGPTVSSGGETKPPSETNVTTASSSETQTANDDKTNDGNNNADGGTATTKEDDSCIPIRLRLSSHGIRIHDDLRWDPSLQDTISLVQVARAVCADLKLPDEAAIAIAVEMAEQVQGRIVVEDCSAQDSGDGGPSDKRNLSGAWSLDQRVHISNVAHLVQQHRADQK